MLGFVLINGFLRPLAFAGDDRIGRRASICDRGCVGERLLGGGDELRGFGGFCCEGTRGDVDAGKRLTVAKRARLLERVP